MFIKWNIKNFRAGSVKLRPPASQHCKKGGETRWGVKGSCVVLPVRGGRGCRWPPCPAGCGRWSSCRYPDRADTPTRGSMKYILDNQMDDINNFFISIIAAPEPVFRIHIPRIRIWIKIWIQIQAIYKIFSLKEVNWKTECCKSH